MRKVLLCLPISIVLLAILALVIWRNTRSIDPLNPDEAAAGDGKVKKSKRHEPIDPTIGDPVKDPKKKPKGGTKGTPLLSGRVLDPKNKPIAKAKITVRYPEDIFGGFEDVARMRALGTFSKKMAILGKATSDEKGAYVVEFADPLEPREYSVEARRSGFITRELSWFHTGAPSTLDIHLDRAGGQTIEGLVVDRAGAPIAKARVEAEQESGDRETPWERDGEEVDRRNTDAEGHFKLEVPSGVFRITAHAKGHAKGTLSAVAAGARGVRIELGPARSLAGRVTDPAGNPVAGAALALYSQNEASIELPSRLRRLVKDPAEVAETGADGAFQFEDLSMESYILEATRAGFQPAQRLGKTSEGDGAAIEIRLAKGAVLEGKVANAAGAPVAGALVLLRDDAVRSKGPDARWLRESARELGAVPREKPAGKTKGKSKAPAPIDDEGPPLAISQADFQARTDAAGKFRLDTLRPSVYTLTVESDQYLPYVKDGVGVMTQSQVSVVLSAGVTLRGRVVEKPGGAPVARATLWLETAGYDHRTVQTDADGKYEAPGITPGPLREVRVRAPGHSLLCQAGPEVLASPPEQEHDFELEQTASVSGKVISMDGRPVANALVQTVGGGGEAAGDSVQAMKRMAASRILRQTERSGRTGADGAFEVKDVNAGPSVQVIVNHPDYEVLFSDPFAVKPGDELTGQVYRLRAGAKLTVLVLRPDRTPCPGARVQAHRQRDESDAGEKKAPVDLVDRKGDKFSLSTSAEGKAVFSGLATGAYSVVVTATGYQTFRQADVAIDETSGGSLSVDLLPENVLTGTVHDSAGIEVEGATLRVTDEVERVPGQKAARERTLVRGMSQNDGSFRLAGLGDGPYRVEATAGGFADLSLDQVPVDRPLDVRLQRLGSIEGTVVIGETGLPVNTFNVVLRRKGKKDEAPADWKGTVRWGPSGSGSRQLEFENAGGSFVLPDLEPGQYAVRVFAADLSPKEVLVRVSEGARTKAAFLLFQGIVVAGQVMSISRNQPVEGANVSVLEAPEEISPGDKRKKSSSPDGTAAPMLKTRPVGEPTTTDETGSFGIRDIPAGKYVLVVYHEEYVQTQQPFEIKAEGLTRDLHVSLDSGETLYGTVEDSGGTHPAGVLVILKEPGGLIRKALTDTAGRFAIKGLMPGTYTITAQLPEDTEPSYEKPVTIKKGENKLAIRIRKQER
jgi:protocatechuate 3,4-dioxygenase beta subunit